MTVTTGIFFSIVNNEGGSAAEAPHRVVKQSSLLCVISCLLVQENLAGNLVPVTLNTRGKTTNTGEGKRHRKFAS